MSFIFNNRGVAHLTQGISALDTQIRIPLETFAQFNRAGARASDFMFCVLRGPVDREIIKIIPAQSNSPPDQYLVCERGQGGTGSQAWPPGTLLFLCTTADHYSAVLQREDVRQVDFNPNGALTPNYQGEKVFQYAGCEIRWFMSFNAVDPYWQLIAGEPCPNERYTLPPGFPWPVWGVPGQLTFIDVDDQGNEYHGVWTQGGYIIAGCSDGGLRTYTADGNGNLTYVAFDFQGGHYVDVWGDGTFIYVACAGDGLRSYSITGAGVPQLKDTIYTGASYQDVWGDGNFVYAATNNGGLKSHAVSAGGLLTQLDSYNVGIGGGDWYEGVYADGNFVYAGQDLEGIKSFTVDGGGNFTLVDHKYAGLFRVRDIWGDGNFIYSVGSNANLGRYGGLASYSVDGGGNMTLLSRWHDFGATQTWSDVWGINNLIFAAVYSDGLYSFSVDAFGVASLLDSHAAAGLPKYRGVRGDGIFLYVCDEKLGLRSYSVT